MTMYDELVKELRSGYCETKLLRKAADALEARDKAAKEWEILAESWKKACKGLESRMPRWVPVTEALPESVDDDVLVTDGEGYAVGYWRPDAQAWDSTDFGWLENRSEPPCGIHTVTHWMPLPEPPKEEKK